MIILCTILEPKRQWVEQPLKLWFQRLDILFLFLENGTQCQIPFIRALWTSYFYFQEDALHAWEALKEGIPKQLEMDFWHAVTGKIGTDDATQAQEDLKLSVHHARLLPPVFVELACTSLSHSSDPLGSLKQLTTASWEVCKTSRSLQDSVDSSDSWSVHTPGCQSTPSSLLPRAAQHYDQLPLQPAETAGNHPVTHTHSFSSFLLAQSFILLWHIICN